MIAPKPKSLSSVEAASAPVVAVTAWQMLFAYARARAGQTILVHGAGGNVGAYAMQIARNAGLEVFATAASKDLDYVRKLGACGAIDCRKTGFEHVVPPLDIVLETVGRETRERSIGVLKPGGILVSVVSTPMPNDIAAKAGVRAVFFIVDVTTARLSTIAELFDSKKLVPASGRRSATGGRSDCASNVGGNASRTRQDCIGRRALGRLLPSLAKGRLKASIARC